MATRTPTYRPSRLSPRYLTYPEPLNSPLHPPTPNLAAQLSWMLQQPDIHPSSSALFPQQQQRQGHFHGTPRSTFQLQRLPPPPQLQAPRFTPQPLTPWSTPQPPTPRVISLLTPQTPRSVRFDLLPHPTTPPRSSNPSQPPTPPSLPSPSLVVAPPRQLQETTQRCTRCTHTLCIPPSHTFILFHTNFFPVNMDRSRPRCVACDLTRTKELCKNVIAPAPGYVDVVQKIEQDLERMKVYAKEGVKVEDMRKGIVEARRRLEMERRMRKERLGRVWERFYGAWGLGVRGGKKD